MTTTERQERRLTTDEVTRFLKAMGWWTLSTTGPSTRVRYDGLDIEDQDRIRKALEDPAVARAVTRAVATGADPGNQDSEAAQDPVLHALRTARDALSGPGTAAPAMRERTLDAIALATAHHETVLHRARALRECLETDDAGIETVIDAALPLVERLTTAADGPDRDAGDLNDRSDTRPQ